MPSSTSGEHARPVPRSASRRWRTPDDLECQEDMAHAPHALEHEKEAHAVPPCPVLPVQCGWVRVWVLEENIILYTKG